MKVIIAGSRTINDPTIVADSVAASQLVITEVVCGEARGADTLGRRWAEANNIPIKSFPAEWAKFGRGAGYIRNADMAHYAEALILIWDGQSPGSRNMKKIANHVGLVVYETIVK